MQTFLPYPDFRESAKVLDMRRLGKQRVEAAQILKLLMGESTSTTWQNHPAVKMWKGYELALAIYGRAICTEWRLRGYKDTLWDYFQSRIDKLSSTGSKTIFPTWLGNKDFHLSHQNALLHKAPFFYLSRFKAPENIPQINYIWPVR